MCYLVGLVTSLRLTEQISALLLLTWILADKHPDLCKQNKVPLRLKGSRGKHRQGQMLKSTHTVLPGAWLGLSGRIGNDREWSGMIGNDQERGHAHGISQGTRLSLAIPSWLQAAAMRRTGFLCAPAGCILRCCQHRGQEAARGSSSALQAWFMEAGVPLSPAHRAVGPSAGSSVHTVHVHHLFMRGTVIQCV